MRIGRGGFRRAAGRPHPQIYGTLLGAGSRPSIEGETNEDSKEVKTDTLNLQATPLANGYVKAKTGTNTTDDVYNKWYDAVYEPQAEAVDTEDTGHTEEPQG